MLIRVAFAMNWTAEMQTRLDQLRASERKVGIMEVLMAFVIIGAAEFLTYLALDAVRHAK
jgi:hypothetical protein